VFSTPLPAPIRLARKVNHDWGIGGGMSQGIAYQVTTNMEAYVLKEKEWEPDQNNVKQGWDARMTGQAEFGFGERGRERTFCDLSDARHCWRKKFFTLAKQLET
jgi:hypothetical protein